MVLPGASILKKDERLTFPWWQHRFGCLQQSVLSFWTGTSLNSKNHLLTPTRESFIRSNLFSVVLFSCSLISKRDKTGEREKSPSGKTAQGNLWNLGTVLSERWAPLLPVQVLKGRSSEVAESVSLPVIKMQLSPLVWPKTVKGDSMWVFTVFFSPSIKRMAKFELW